jgi:hypothetical protein
MTARARGAPEEPAEKTGISLYEFYAIGIERLIEKSPWELERAVSAYHESFLTEQRCLGLAILLLLGESHVPAKAVQSMPGFEEQTRASVNQAIFLRALRRYFDAKGLSTTRADMVLERMQSYITDSRTASQKQKDPLEAMLQTVVKRVPPKDDTQKKQYAVRIGKIFDYIQALVEKSLLKRYEVSS